MEVKVAAVTEAKVVAMEDNQVATADSPVEAATEVAVKEVAKEVTEVNLEVTEEAGNLGMANLVSQVDINLEVINLGAIKVEEATAKVCPTTRRDDTEQALMS